MNAHTKRLEQPRFEGHMNSSRRIAILTLPMLLLVLTAAPVFGHSTTTHQTLADYAAQKAASLTTPVNFTTTQRSLLQQGANDEDNGTRSVNHAYNPVSGGSFPTGTTAKNEISTRWSSMTAAFAAGNFNGGDGSGAWHYLGRASHLMEDMTSPLHAFAIDHLGIYAVSESCKFEAYWGANDSTLRSIISSIGGPLHSSTLDAKATERLDSFSTGRLQDRFNNSSPNKGSDDPRGWVETMVWSAYFRATFWGEVTMGNSVFLQNVNGPATSLTTTSTTFSDGTVGSQVNVLDKMFGNGNVRWINNYIGDDYYEITDRNGYVSRWMSMTDIDDWSSCGRFWANGQRDTSARIGGSDDDSDGVRITGRFWFDLRELGKSTSGTANRYCYPRYYPNGNSMTDHLHQYFGNYLYPLTVRYNAGLLGLANRRVTAKTADSTQANGFVFGRADNFGNGGSSFNVGSGGSAFFFVAKSSVTLTAPASNTGGLAFVRWLRDGSTFSGNTSRTITINDSSVWIPEAGVTYTAEYQTPISVTVQTSPSGRSFSVDGTNYTSSRTFSWIPSSSHTIATTSPQSGSTGVQYYYNSWSDGGAMSHTVSPSSGTTYTANFTTQYYLTMSAGFGGTVSPSSGWYNSGAGVQISASPNSGYHFTSWTGSGSGSYSGNNNPASITMNGPITETASFTENPPPAPTAYAATTVTSSGFTANWSSASGATGYRLDVSTSSTFAGFVSGYQDLDVGNVTSQGVSGLSAGTTYYYRVRGYNSGGPSGNSGTISLTTIPASPSVNSASGVTNTAFTANWNSTTGATGYRLDVSTSSTFASFVSGYQDLDAGNVTARSVSGLAVNTPYYYRVRAYNGTGTSGNSGTMSVTTLPNPPSAPTANAATSVAANSFTANWSSASGATGYRLDVSTSSTFASFVSGYQDLDVGNVLSQGVSGLNAGTTYYYRVRAYNTGGASGNSGTITIVTVPSAPVEIAASGVTNTVFTANWNTSSGATGYRLDVSTSSTFASFVSGYQDLDVGNVASKTVSALTAGTTYYYRVRTYNTGGTSGNSGTITVVTVPPVPVASAASGATSSGFTANWGSATGATGYRLDVSTSSTFASFVSGYQDLDVGNVASKSVTGLSAGTTYYYRVRAYNTGGTSGSSGTITTATVPADPTANAVSGVTNTAFTANWSIVSGATGYRLDVSASSLFDSYVSGYQNLDVGNVLTKAVSGLSAGTTYYYRVRAYNTGGTSGNSGTITVATLPAAPTANTASGVSNTAFTANWSSVSGATGYRLDVSTSSTFASFVSGYQNLDVGTATSQWVSGLNSSTTYYYRVRAYNTGGTSGNSGTITVITVPAAPTANAASGVTNTAFTANWGSVSGATGYRLDVSMSSLFDSYVSGYQDLSVGNVLTKAVSGLTAGTTYYYRVRAYNTGGASGNSGTITVVTVPAVPTANAATSVTSSSFTANWSNVSGATGYRLDVATNSTFTSYVSGYQNVDVGTATSQPVNGLSAGKTYYYRVRAYNAGGTSGNSGTITVAVVPTVPTANAASGVTNTAFTANWSSVSGATGYRLDVSTSSLFDSYVSGYQDLNVSNVTSKAVSGLNAGTIYYYRVRAYNAGGASDNSSTITVVTVPAAPVVGAASSVTSTGFTANWNSTTGATGYRLDVATNSTFTSYVSGYQNLDVGAATSQPVNGLSAGRTYYYRVRAYNAGGTSGNSGTNTVVIVPAVPTANAASGVTNTAFTANWGSVSGATGYRLDVSTSSLFDSYVSGYQDLNVSNVTSKAVSGLSAGTTYYYRVRAYNAGGTSANSGTITVVTVPPAPVIAAASSVTSTGFTANWSSTPGATGYRLDVATNSTFASYVTGNQNLDVGNVLSQNVTGLIANKAYYYRVRAYNGAGTSGNSGTNSVTTLPPMIVTTVQSNKLVLSWPTNDSAFKLFYATNLPAATWISNAVAPAVVNGQYTITNSMTNNARFYRLKK